MAKVQIIFDYSYMVYSLVDNSALPIRTGYLRDGEFECDDFPGYTTMDVDVALDMILELVGPVWEANICRGAISWSMRLIPLGPSQENFDAYEFRESSAHILGDPKSIQYLLSELFPKYIEYSDV